MASNAYVHVPRLSALLPRTASDGAITVAITRLKYSRATVDQEGAIREFVLGRDVFVWLPTGSGKSLCYAALPFVFDILRARAGSVVVVKCPLQFIMEVQVK